MPANSPPVVSVIIPCYKATEFITEALASLRAQTLRNFETILVNDACPDSANLERVLQPFMGEIIYLRHEVNQGPSASRNTGIRAAQAPLIAMLDSDDVWEPGYLEVQAGILAERPEVDVVYPNAEFFGSGSWSGKAYMEMIPSRGEVTFRSLVLRECNVFTGVTARREALLRVGLFDPMLRRSEDFDLWLRLARAGSRFTYHERKLVRYRLSENSLSDDKVSLQIFALKVYQKLLAVPDLTKEHRELVEQVVRKQTAVIDWFLGKKAVYSRDRNEALSRLASANKILRDKRVAGMILLLRLWPALLFRYIHRTYPTEYSYLH